MTPMPQMAPGGASLLAWLPALPIAAAALLYLARVRRLRARGDRWPLPRSVSAVAGLGVLAGALLPPVGTHADVFAVHVLGHLLLAMLAPLLLALSAPVTLALRTVSGPARRRLLAALHSAPARALSRLPLALVLEVGGMYAFYLTPLFALAHAHLWVSVLVHVHMFLAGCLLSWLLVGRDPLPHRPRLGAALAVLLIAGAAHGILAKLMYAHGLPAMAGTPAQVQLGAQVMFSGGDVVEVALAVALLSAWYAREGRAQRRENVRSAPRDTTDRRRAGSRRPPLSRPAPEGRRA